jgi:hypothetical protein
MTTRHVTGHFYVGQAPQTICFIPDSCVKVGAILELNWAAYQKGNWPFMNLRVNEHGFGGHLFPLEPLQSVLEPQDDLIRKLQGNGIFVTIAAPLK